MKHNRVYSQIKLQLSPVRDREQKWKPYRDIPFTPQGQIRPFLQRLNRDMSSVAKNQKIRKLASRQIQGHFLGQHGRYKSKQNVHSSCFRVKAKKDDREQENEGFWLGRLHARQRGIRGLMEEYLNQVGEEMLRRREWSETEGEWNKQQKVINEYNIIYEYRSQHLLGYIPK